MRTTTTAGLLAAAMTFCLASAALGDEDHHEGAAFGRPGDPDKVTRTVTIEATEIAYDKHELAFEAGETVRFVLVNKGEQNHELTIGDAETQHAHREMMAEMPDMDHGHMSHEELAGIEGHDHMMEGNMVDTEPGETKSFVWQFTEPGSFEFACNYPGHAELGMVGTITVK
jgi:uncharacterized cupredoxin-like copper-binding protein